ncbi:MAG TPA: hypothetical protein VMD52_05930 [Patescibacteria group bacterium]|nr:hypothetical protein [Patescibacteria group bacterium]
MRLPAKLKHPELLASLWIFLYCFIPRLLLLSKGPFQADVLDLLVGMRDKAITPHGSHFPLPSIIALLLAYLKDILHLPFSDLALLLWATAFLASAASVLIYLLCKRIFDAKPALVYALVASFGPAFFSVTTFGRIDYALAVFLLPVSLFYFVRKRLLSCSLFTGLCILSRPESSLIVPAYLAAVMIGRLRDGSKPLWLRPWRAVGDWVLSLAVPVLCLAALWLVTAPSAASIGYTGIRLEQLKESALFDFGLMCIPLGFAIFGILQKLFGKDNGLAVLFLVLLLLTFGFVAGLGYFSSRWLVIPFFFFSFFIAHGIASVFETRRAAILFSIFCALLMVNSVIEVVYDRHAKAYQVDFAGYVAMITEPDSVILARQEGVFLSYYAKRKVIIPPAHCDRQQWDDFSAQIEKFIKDKKPVYVISDAFNYDPCRYFQDFVYNNFVLYKVGEQLNEDWQRMTLPKRLFLESIFRLNVQSWVEKYGIIF